MSELEWVELCKLKTGMTPREFKKQFSCEWKPELIVISEKQYSELNQQIEQLQTQVKQLEQSNQWISVDDEIKPKHGQELIVLREYKDCEVTHPLLGVVVKYHISDFIYSNNSFNWFDDIVAWMPNVLPTPPTEGVEDGI